MTLREPTGALPVVGGRARPGIAAEMPIERRVGRFLARAKNDEAFEHFYGLVRTACKPAISSPIRLLGVTHLANSVATRLRNLPEESKPLVEGFIFELLSQQQLLRRISLTNAREPQPVIVMPATASVVDAALDVLTRRLHVSHSLTYQEAVNSVPKELVAWNRNLGLLLGILVYRGIATTDDRPGLPLQTIREPLFDHRR